MLGLIAGQIAPACLVELFVNNIVLADRKSLTITQMTCRVVATTEQIHPLPAQSHISK